MNHTAIQINDIIRKHPDWDYAKHEIDQKPGRMQPGNKPCIFVTVKGWDRAQALRALAMLRTERFVVHPVPPSPASVRKESGFARLVITGIKNA